jgi:hypothetical protein
MGVRSLYLKFMKISTGFVEISFIQVGWEHSDIIKFVVCWNFEISMGEFRVWADLLLDVLL